MDDGYMIATGMLPLHEPRLSLKELAARVPVKPVVGTVRLWADIGLKHRKTGEVIVLETSLEGGRRYTTWERYVEFQRKMNAPDPSK